jgi:hypothetical protein
LLLLLQDLHEPTVPTVATLLLLLQTLLLQTLLLLALHSCSMQLPCKLCSCRGGACAQLLL